jgi:hypothetical protein
MEAVATIKEFKDLGIKSEVKSFTGPKISINKLLNQKITVLKYQVEPSKFADKGDGNRLRVQIIFQEEHRIFFTNSLVLRDLLEKTNKDDFPFYATLVIVNERLEFR